MLTRYVPGDFHNWDRHTDARRSLLLDKVMQGRPRTSASRLFMLPAEILAAIIDFLVSNKAALASLALVNSDCRYLAHTRQFVGVHFDYSLLLAHVCARSTLRRTLWRAVIETRVRATVSIEKSMFPTLWISAKQRRESRVDNMNY